MEPLREIRNRLLNGWQLSKMHTFEVAARHQSFALAAEELSLSPSAVSHRINQLEEELGIQLFVRSHRKVELTHEGKRVYWALKSSLDTLNQEILDIKNQELSGTLTLYSRPSIAQCWLVPALGDFTRRYPPYHGYVSAALHVPDGSSFCEGPPVTGFCLNRHEPHNPAQRPPV